MKNWMMDIEEFVDGYFYGCVQSGEVAIDEVIEDVGMYFKSNEATKYAKRYITEQMGEV
jgi:hypothetical protein